LHAHSFQKAVAEKLAPKEVDPNDKSVKAWFTRARNAALKGMTHDIHADIVGDEKLTEVRLLTPTQHSVYSLHACWLLQAQS
jgi:hypothetical protein